jgi:hypothetical protein
VGGDAHSHRRAATGRAPAVIGSGAPIVMCERRARRRDHWHFAKMPQIPHQTRLISASTPGLGLDAGTSATECLPDGPPVGIIIASGRPSGRCPITLPGEKFCAEEDI